MSVPKEFRSGFDRFEADAKGREVQQVWAARKDNAKEAWRIARYVPNYDRIGFWPHIHTPHDEQVTPMMLGKFFALFFGAVFSLMLTESMISDPTLVTYVGASVTFFAISWFCEAGVTAWLPIPRRFEDGPAVVWKSAFAAAVPLVTWGLMRVPGTFISDLADDYEGIVLVAIEVTVLVFGAVAGTTARALAWSRRHSEIDQRLRAQLIALGAQSPDPAVDDVEVLAE